MIGRSVCPSVCHTRALWLIQRTYQRFFYTTWKGNPSSQMWSFVQLCSSWQDFNWLKASRGPSAIAELVVKHSSENCIKIRWLLTKLQTKLSWLLFMSEYSFLTAHQHILGYLVPTILSTSICTSLCKLAFQRVFNRRMTFKPTQGRRMRRFVSFIYRCTVFHKNLAVNLCQ